MPARGLARWHAQVIVRALYTFFRWRTGIDARTLLCRQRLARGLGARQLDARGDVHGVGEIGQHLAAHGLKYSDGPTMKENGGGFAFIDAPEGYEIELIQPAKTPSTGGY